MSVVTLNQAPPHTRKPDWFKVPIPGGTGYNYMRALMGRQKLHSICESGRCPNIAECWAAGTASFMILGDICTRKCKYCRVKTGLPTEYDEAEPRRLATAIAELKLKYVVITSVTRDDLDDGGAAIFGQCVELLQAQGVRVELLTPDFRWRWEILDGLLATKPEVLGHNIETVRAFYKRIRRGGDYTKTLEFLQRVADYHGVISKTAFMVGIGESWLDIEELLIDLRKSGVERLAVGQYLQPTKKHWPVARYYRPSEFEQIKKMAYDMGFGYIEAGPLVRSSYHAEKAGAPSKVESL